MTQDEKNRDELLMAYLLGELDSQQANEISQWIAMSEKNLQHFEEVSKIWSGRNAKNQPSFNKDIAWNNISKKINKAPFYHSPLFKVAAAILILLGAINWFLNTKSNQIPATVFSQHEIINDTLQDGSVVTLNSNSSLAFADNFDGSTREVSLKGEAFFDIERDTNKPFIIHLDQSMVKVLGTSFNIKSDPEDELVSVFVKSGVVLFEYLSDTKDSSYLSIELRAGDKVIYNKNTNKLEPSDTSSEVSLDMYWMNQELVFDGIQLGKVTRILEIVYDVEISFSDQQSKNCLLTVNFQNAKIDQIMEVISSTFELELTQNNNAYQLIGTSCEEL